MLFFCFTGYFPHYFNWEENRDYIGPLPALKYYGRDDMDLKQRNELIRWWEQEKTTNDYVCFQEAMSKYCRLDCDILRHAPLEFCRLYLSVGGTDVTRSITIVSGLMALFRTKYLQKKVVGLVPAQGYHRVDRQSKIALKYLRHLEHQHNIQI